MLQRNQIVQYGSSLYRVDYVNACRARLVPLAKRHVVLGDREFDAHERGINVSPNSDLPIITET